MLSLLVLVCVGMCWYVLVCDVFVMCLCLVVFGCVSMRYYVMVCVVFVVLLVGVNALAVVWW